MRLTVLAAVLLAAVAAASAAAGGGFPNGSYTESLSGKSPAFLNGAWKLTFLPGGKYTTSHPANAVVARGKVAVSGGTVTFGKETGSLACTTSGKYRWTYRGGTLRFTTIADACGGRNIVLAAKPFKSAA